MIKLELILRAAAENPHLSEGNVEQVVNAILGRIVNTLVAGDLGELRGLGIFTTTASRARTGRNPKTGKAVPVKTQKLPWFKPNRAMHARLNPSGSVTGAELNAEVERLSRAS